MNIELRYQPTSSPDSNILDLGVFNPLQTRQRRHPVNYLSKLADSVNSSFDKLPTSTIDPVFSALQCVMNDCIRAGGDNAFKIAHMSKKSLEREGRLPCSIRCSRLSYR